jgi:hypothetical protein
VLRFFDKLLLPNPTSDFKMETGPMKQRRFSTLTTRILLSCATLLLVNGIFSTIAVQPANAQTSRIKHVITSEAGFVPLLGRDLWFAMAQNYDAGGANGKVDVLYVTSQNNTTVHIGILSQDKAYPISANTILSFRVPLGWEMNSSGVVEDKGVRVWSPDADLSAYLMSFNPYTSEGKMIIPTIGWGTDYVVAAYAGLYESTFDYPSEYTVVANQNNTVVNNISPTDIRLTRTPTVVLHKALQPFTDVFKRGQCAQYISIQAQNCDNYDMTGTVLNSNFPIGIEGASQCPNIPCDYPYCDFVTEENQPIRTWTNSYMSVPFAQRHSNNGDTFLAIPSYNGQTIYCEDATRGTGLIFCTGLPKYSPFWFDAVTYPTRFYSDSAFELLQYENSSTWADGSTGDAAMTTLNGVSQYTPKVVFQTPVVANLPYTFTNFVNIICPAGQGAHTKLTINGTPRSINSVTGGGKAVFYDSKNWEGHIIGGLEPGMHVITCDTINGVPGVAGAYIYGYGSYDSYAWPGGIGNRTFNNQDTFPPLADTSGQCFCAHVTMSDYVHPVDTKISTINLDSLNNMYFTLDPNYLAGTNMDSSFYDMCVADSSKSAYMKVTVYDNAGNQTHIASTYKPQTAILNPPITNFGIGIAPGVIEDTIYVKNTGVTPFNLTTLKLQNGKLGFSLKNYPLGLIPVGDSVRVFVDFTPVTLQAVQDTIFAGDACVLQQALVIGSGGAPDFLVTSDDFGCIDTGSSTTNLKVTITNPSKGPITIDSIAVSDPVHFKYMNSPALPFTIAPKATPVQLLFQFTATTLNPHVAALGTFYDHADNIIKTDSLIGCGIVPVASFFADTADHIVCSGSSTFGFTVQNPSSLTVQINKLTATPDPASPAGSWSAPQLVDQYGTPLTFPEDLSSGTNQQLYVSVTFTPPAKACGIFRDTIEVLDNNLQPIMHNGLPYCIAVDTVTYREATLSTTNITFPPVLYGSTPITSTFTVTNTGNCDAVNVTAFTLSGVNKVAYSISSTLPALPANIPSGGKLQVTVSYDPSVDINIYDSAQILMQANVCDATPLMTVQSSKVFGPASASGFTVPASFACSQTLDSVIVTNSNSAKGVDSIVSVNSNSVNFTPVVTLPLAVGGGSKAYVPVLFAATPGGGSVPYNGTITIILKRPDGTDSTLTAAVAGTAVGINSTVSSTFANLTAHANTNMSLPINISFNKNGLATPLTAAGITGAHIVYAFDQDRFQIPTTGAITGLFGDWKATYASDQGKGLLTIDMSGTTAIADGTTSLGAIAMTSMLTKNGSQSFNINLDTVIFKQSNGTPVNQCVAVQTAGTQFGVILACGDSTIATILGGGTIAGFTQPVHPNPVSATSSNKVSIGYATRGMMQLSMSIYDELGRDVSPVFTNLVHQAGVYEVSVDVSKLPSGTYTCNLSGPRWSGTQEFIVSR